MQPPKNNPLNKTKKVISPIPIVNNNKTTVINGVPYTPRNDSHLDDNETAAALHDELRVPTTENSTEAIMKDPLRAKIYLAAENRPLDTIDDSEIMTTFHSYSKMIP
jgi:hypothetical protein